MRQTAKERARRVVVGAILSSELSSTDIWQVAESFLGDPDFCRSIGRALQLVNPGGLEPTNVRRENGWYKRANDLVRQKKIPKREVVGWLSQYLPADAASTTRTFVHILKNAEQLLPDGVREEFMNWLATRSPQDDEYLKGILKER